MANQKCPLPVRDCSVHCPPHLVTSALPGPWVPRQVCRNHLVEVGATRMVLGLVGPEARQTWVAPFSRDHSVSPGAESLTEGPTDQEERRLWLEWCISSGWGPWCIGMVQSGDLRVLSPRVRENPLPLGPGVTLCPIASFHWCWDGSTYGPQEAPGTGTWCLPGHHTGLQYGHNICSSRSFLCWGQHSQGCVRMFVYTCVSVHA